MRRAWCAPCARWGGSSSQRPGTAAPGRAARAAAAGTTSVPPGGAEAASKLQDGGPDGTSLLDVNHLPPQLAELVRQSYGDATGRIFLIAAACALVSLVAVLFIREVPLRRTVAKLDEPTQRRRLYAFLARRGYESDHTARVTRLLVTGDDES